MGFSLINSLDYYDIEDVDYIVDIWNICGRHLPQFIAKCETELGSISNVLNKAVDKYIASTAEYICGRRYLMNCIKITLPFYEWVAEQKFESINTILPDDFDHYGYKFINSVDCMALNSGPNAVLFINALDRYNHQILFNYFLDHGNDQTHFDPNGYIDFFAGVNGSASS